MAFHILFLCLLLFACPSLYTDLNQQERTSDTPELTVAILSSSSDVVLLQQDSKLPLSQLPLLLNVATKGCQALFKKLKDELKKYSESVLHARGMINA